MSVSLKRNVAWTFAGSTAYALSQWVTVVIIVKFTGPEALGAFVLALAIVSPVFLITDLKLGTVLVTDAGGEYRFGHYLAARLIGVAVSVAILSIALALGLGSAEVIGVYALVALFKCADSVAEIFLALLQRHERMDAVARARLLQAVVGTVAAVAAGWAFGSVHAIVAALAGASVGVQALYTIPKAARCGPATASRAEAVALVPLWDRDAIARMVARSWPLGFAALIASAFEYVPRYVVEHYYSLQTLGYFAGIASLVLAGNVVLSALVQSVMPRLANLFDAGDVAAFEALVRKLLAVGALLGIAGVLLVLAVGDAVIRIALAPDFVEYSWLLTWFAVVFLARASFAFFSPALQSMRIFHVQYRITAAAAAALVALVPPMVAIHGLAGVCAALLIARVVEGALYAYTYRREIGTRSS